MIGLTGTFLKRHNDFRFLSLVIRLIMCYVRSSSLAILWNDNRLEHFSLTRCLRQRNPLSPYLFVMCMEMLAVYINNKVEEGYWRSISVSRGGPPILHLMFADDVLLYCS